jgi:hypothetical protein
MLRLWPVAHHCSMNATIIIMLIAIVIVTSIAWLVVGAGTDDAEFLKGFCRRVVLQSNISGPPMSALGRKRTFDGIGAMSALPPQSDRSCVAAK